MSHDYILLLIKLLKIVLMQYHHHKISSTTFRSVPEVVNFIIFEMHPPKPKSKTHEAAGVVSDNVT